MSLRFLLLLAAVTIALPARADVEIRQCFAFDAAQQTRLRRLVRTDLEARARLKELEMEAGEALKAEPHPLAVIHYEGRLDTDPLRIETERALLDMDRLAVLAYAWAATGDERYARKARAYVHAWTQAYQPTGNPINENKLEPVFCAYQMLRPGFSKAEQEHIENWIQQIAHLEIQTATNFQEPGRAKNNWDSKRLKLIAFAGEITANAELAKWARDGFRHYVADALFADSTSRDLHDRDALSYHVSGLDPLLVLALRAGKEGLALYDYRTPSGASLRKSVEFVYPYARGTRTYAQWVNSRVELDRKRAAAGIEHYRPGKPFNPQEALPLMELARWFDPSCSEILAKLHETDSRHPSWMSVVIDALKP